MKVTLDPGARADLDDIHAFIAERNEIAAREMIARIEAKIAFLETPGLEHIGRPGLEHGTRELIEYPYIIVYEVFEERDEIVVWSVVHGARDREREGS
jgi:plasmid stabilization system protein ParE